jgi:hypothetical protein
MKDLREVGRLAMGADREVELKTQARAFASGSSARKRTLETVNYGSGAGLAGQPAPVGPEAEVHRMKMTSPKRPFNWHADPSPSTFMNNIW